MMNLPVQSRLTKSLVIIAKKLKWPENFTFAYPAVDRLNRCLNPLLTPASRSDYYPGDYRFPPRSSHWKSRKFHGIVFVTVSMGVVCTIAFRDSEALSSNEYERGNIKSVSSYLPLRTASSLWGKINSYNLPPFIRPAIFGVFCRTYNCDMSEAIDENYKNYRNLSELFSRRLKPSKRPISKEPGVISPADGLILHIGPIKGGQIEDVKQIDYSIDAFLGLNGDELLKDKENNELYNCIIYLAPGDCHRFHSPTKWQIKNRKHFPGTLVSVNPKYMKKAPEILHTNERVSYLGEWSHGFFSMTAVGATNVGSIKVNFDEDLRTNRRHLWRPDRYACFEHEFQKAVEMRAGQDFGEFNFGSTIVLIFEAPKNSTFSAKVNQKIKYGQLMARIEESPQPPVNARLN